MNTNVNFAAPLGALALLGTGFVLLVAFLFLLYSLAVQRFGRARLLLAAKLVVGMVYAAVLLGFSLASSDKVLARGQEKHFCEIDCHLAYSIADARQSKTIGAAANQVTANGTFTILTIRTRFDDTTIGRNRGDGLLYPNSRVLTIVDAEGRKYLPSPDAQRALEISGAAGKPITTPLRPGESYTTTVAFDLPAAAGNPMLQIIEGAWETHLVIGHENSPLHKRTRFQI